MSQLPVVWQALLQFFLAKRFVRETGDDSVASFMTELLQTLGEGSFFVCSKKKKKKKKKNTSKYKPYHSI